MNAAAPAPVYAAAAADPARDRETVLGIWRGNLGEPARMQAKFDWVYRDSPLGAPLTMILHHLPSGEAVGVATAAPRRMRIGAREIRAGVLIDLAVLPAHRTLGPALQLQQALLDAGSTRFDLLYGFPNRKAVPVFKRVGYGSLGELVRHARVLRYRQYFAQRVPRPLAALAGPIVDLGLRLRDSWRSRSDPRWRTLWVDSTATTGDAQEIDAELLHGVHDRQFLGWRFDPRPIGATRTLQLLDPDSGQLQAWFVCHDSDGALYVADCGAAAQSLGASRAQVDALVRAARAAGYRSVSVQLAAPPDLLAAWRNCGFAQRSARPIFGRWFGTGPQPEHYYLTAADEDE